MLYIFMGPSCSGKSTVANKVKELINVEVFTGKDYLRLAKSENEAWRLFFEKLSNAAANKDLSKENVIYLITEKAQLERINTIEGMYKVKFNASIETINSRFAKRMNGKLPPPIEKMLTNQYEQWKSIEGDISVDTTVESDVEKIVSSIVRQ